MKRYKATVELYVQLPETLEELPGYTGPSSTLRGVPQIPQEDMLADAIGDTLRELVDDSFLIDWAYAPDGNGGFMYAEPFEGPTPEEQYQAENAERRGD